MQNAIDVKFSDPVTTLDGSKRASVDFSKWKTLLSNSGTLCNIVCANCYIKGSPTNYDMLYLNAEDTKPYFTEPKSDPRLAKEIGFIAGELLLSTDINQL